MHTRSQRKRQPRKTRRKHRIFRVDPRIWEDPRNVLLYLSERGIPRVIPTAERVIADAREYLKDEDYMWGTQLWATAKSWPPVSESVLVDVVQKARTQKYMDRPSPRFPAGPLCGVTLKGNDGDAYVSVRGPLACAWKRV